MATTSSTAGSALPFSARYVAAAAELRKTEGGFVDDKTDRGGTTNFGISLRFLVVEGKIDANGDGLADFDLDMDGDIDGKDIRLLTWDQAAQLYHRCFWQAVGADSLPKPIGEMLFDQAVNGGLAAARKLLQRALLTCQLNIPAKGRSIPLLRVDGAIGPTTKAVLQMALQHPSLGAEKVAEAYRDAVRERYRAIVRANSSQQKFLRGWLARADRLGR